MNKYKFYQEYGIDIKWFEDNNPKISKVSMEYYYLLYVRDLWKNYNKK